MTSTTTKLPINPKDVHTCKWCDAKFVWSDAQDKRNYCSREHELKDETYGE